MNILAGLLRRRCPRAALSAMVLTAAFGIDAGVARAGLQTSYSVTIDAGMPDVTDIFIFETYPPYRTAGTYSFVAPGGATSVFVNPFNLDGPPAQSLLLGIVNGLPSDGASPVDHLVLFLDPTVAATIVAKDLSFSSLFPGTSEADLISTFEFVVRTPSGTSDWLTAYYSLLGFLDDVHRITIPTDAGTTTVDGYFAGPDGTTPGQATAIAFSDPQPIGTATSTLIGASVPEPSSLALGAIGALGGLGYARRRRRRPAAA